MVNQDSLLAEAQRALKTCRDQHEAALTRQARNAADRAQLSYAAAMGDQKAKTRLGQLAAEVATIGQEIESAGFAITEAERHVTLATAAVAEAKLRATVRALRPICAKVRADAKKAGEAIKALGASLESIRHGMIDLTAGGMRLPDHAVIAANLRRALNSELGPLRLGTDLIPPSQRITFDALFESYMAAVEAQIAQIVGDESEEAA